MTDRKGKARNREANPQAFHGIAAGKRLNRWALVTYSKRNGNPLLMEFLGARFLGCLGGVVGRCHGLTNDAGGRIQQTEQILACWPTSGAVIGLGGALSDRTSWNKRVPTPTQPGGWGTLGQPASITVKPLILSTWGTAPWRNLRSHSVISSHRTSWNKT